MAAKVLSLPLSDREKSILHELRDLLIRDFGNHLKLLKLFGSRSRGEGSEFSDFDVLAVVDGEPWRLSDEMHDAVYPLMRKYDYKIVISLIVLSKDHFSQIKRIRTNFYQNVKRDGIDLWTAA